MKKILIISFILLNLKSLGQKLYAVELQEQRFDKAEKLFKKKKFFKALQQYDVAHRSHLNNDYKQKAKTKIDSLLPILQKIEMKRWIGIWKLKQLKTNLFNYEKIVLTDKLISFYEKENDSIPKRNENIEMAEYNSNEYVSLLRVVFDNQEIWEFSVDKVKRENRLFVKLRKDSKGKTFVENPHGTWTTDRKKRRKAMSEETRTFYVKAK